MWGQKDQDFKPEESLGRGFREQGWPLAPVPVAVPDVRGSWSHGHPGWWPRAGALIDFLAEVTITSHKSRLSNAQLGGIRHVHGVV